jgi:adenylate cyclase
VTGSSWTFALIDLAGFTALAEFHGDERAADLAVTFAQAAELRLGPGDRLVKTIGDAVLLASPEPASGIKLVGRILDAMYQTEGFPIARAGLHHGPAVERDGDLFGTAVNITARVAGLARGGQVLATEAVAKAGRETGMEVASVGSFSLKNLSDPVELWELTLSTPADVGSVDPVCRMFVLHHAAAGRLRHKGADYWFCSMDCAATFAAAPERFAPA